MNDSTRKPPKRATSSQNAIDLLAQTMEQTFPNERQQINQQKAQDRKLRQQKRRQAR